MTIGYVIPLTCPRCGADVEHVGTGRSYAWHQVAAIRCSACRWEGAVKVELVTIQDATARADGTRRDPYEAMVERRRKNRQKVTI